MWGTLGETIDVHVEELAPKLLREWLARDSSASLMAYLWNAYMGDRDLSEYELESAEDALRFLSIAMLVAGALEIASGADTLDAWDWVEVPETLVHPFILGYLLASRGEVLDFEIGFDGNLNALIKTYESEVVGGMATKLTDTEFFIAIWSAHLGINQFPPRDEDMAECDFYLDTVTPDQGRFFDYISGLWPRSPKKIADSGRALL